MIWKSLFSGSGLDWYSINQLDQIPTAGGAYVLIVFLSKEVEFSSPKTGSILLDKGFYFYAGSAKGPGGLRSRLSRHFKSDKKPHWHIDQLTIHGKAVGAYVKRSGNECDLVDLMLKTKQLAFVQDGIGGTDCSRCKSHLLKAFTGKSSIQTN
ncbi:GIY-YIG nuclease family protein [Lentilitoribacter sp. EG35]|uniref:GIY-YIG nuclease family protein n=1 Tax=Lentilitoribacter sp. EG35 TaxID=3234192 RepID=UPI003461491F